MRATLSEELNNLTNKEKIKFAKLLKTFKGGADTSLEVAKYQSSNNKDAKDTKNYNQSGGVLKQLLGGFIGGRLQALKEYMTPKSLKAKEDHVIQKAGSSSNDNISSLTNAINNLNKLLESNQSQHNLKGGMIKETIPIVNKKKRDTNSKKGMNKKVEKKKSIKKSVKPKKKTYKKKTYENKNIK